MRIICARININVRHDTTQRVYNTLAYFHHHLREPWWPKSPITKVRNTPPDRACWGQSSTVATEVRPPSSQQKKEIHWRPHLLPLGGRKKRYCTGEVTCSVMTLGRSKDRWGVQYCRARTNRAKTMAANHKSVSVPPADWASLVKSGGGRNRRKRIREKSTADWLVRYRLLLWCTIVRTKIHSCASLKMFCR